jgi:hypothetical protein
LEFGTDDRRYTTVADDNMALVETLRKMSADGDVDVLREGVRVLAEAIIEAEVSELTGAAKGARDPQRRPTHRNGYRERRWDTRVGSLALAIPRERDGSSWGSETPIRDRTAPLRSADVVSSLPGCNGSTNKAGDYNKEGQTWHGSRAIQQSMNTQVWDAQYSSQKVNKSCSNCWYIDIAHDTNPRWECDFKTWHSVWNGSQVLNGHFHWTEAATSSSGC